MRKINSAGGLCWSSHVKETMIRIVSESIPFFLEGGAEHGAFLQIGRLLSNQSGDLKSENLVLRLQGKVLSGMTSSSANLFLEMCAKRDKILSLEIISPEHLKNDLRQFLSSRFSKGSFDHDLQNAIRDNLYLETVPCTTRCPKLGETDGIDYRFLTVDEFRQLDADGQLLESGIFEANLYGTPRPTGEVTVNFDYFWSESELISGRQNRQTNHLDLQNALNGTETMGQDVQLASTSEEEKIITNGHSDDNLGALPPNWEVAYSEQGEKYFIDHNESVTQWDDPRSKRTLLSDSHSNSPLPHGWERVHDPVYGTFYVDHVSRRTQYERPNPHCSQLGPRLNETATIPMVGHQNVEMPPFRMRTRSMFTRDPSRLCGELLITSVEMGPRGLGLTLIGNDSGSPCEEFLQIKNVIPHGPAHKDGVLRRGDVLVHINEQCVLGCTQEQAIELFRAIAVGQLLTLRVCRGYPLLLDSADQVVTQDAYCASLSSQTTFNTIYVIKGDDGFGFTIADSLYGQRVKKVLSPDRCPGLREEDILCEINTKDVRRMTHTDLVDVLRDCAVGHRISILVQRNCPQNYMHHSQSHYASRPNSYHQNRESKVHTNRRSKTPTSAFRYGEKPNAPVVKARSKTPAPKPPDRPRKTIDNNNAIDWTRKQLNTSTRTIEGIYENLPASGKHDNVTIGKQCRPSLLSPSSFEPATPNYVPLSTYVSQDDNDDVFGQAFSLITVNLIRQPNGFGFRVVGGTEEGTSIIVGQIVSGGAADLDGRLKPGDELAEIDGQEILGGRHQHAVSLMQKAAGNGHVKLLIRRQIDKAPILLPSSSLSSRPFTLTLDRQPDSGFGFVIISSVPGLGSTIGRILTNSPADKCGRLKVGDRIIAVNGVDIVPLNHGEIVALIKDSGLTVALTVGAQEPINDKSSSLNRSMNGMPDVIERQPSLSSILDSLDHVGTEQYSELKEFDNITVSDTYGPDQTCQIDLISKFRSKNEDHLLSVRLPRGPKGFGFSIRGGQEFGSMPLFVLRIADGGPAHSDGRLKVGDQLVEIDGISTQGMRHEEAIQSVKGKTVVCLLVRRQARPGFDDHIHQLDSTTEEADWNRQAIHY